MKVKNVALFGATGSIGRNAIEVIKNNSDLFRLFAISGHSNVELLSRIASDFRPHYVVVTSDKPISIPDGITLLRGIDGLKQVAAHPDVDIVLVATSGIVGVFPTIEALKNGKRVALANKETLVSFGKVVTDVLKNGNGEIIPVDSEHSAIFQLLNGVKREEVDKIVLTASGGPFRTWSVEQLRNATVRDALKHPTWSMGSKITIDSATLMNKGLEVIEAYWLFGYPIEKIDVVVHPQSIIHGMVMLKDGAILAHLSATDMKLPIQYALSFPNRLQPPVKPINLVEIGKLTFEKPDTDRFPALKLAYDALKMNGSYPAILNASNEVAVYAFLEGKIRFTDIPKVVENVMEKHRPVSGDTLEELLDADRWAREEALKLIKRMT